MFRGKTPLVVRRDEQCCLICAALAPSFLAMQLAAKQVWKDSTQWKGWLMCAQQLVPDSFPALLGLPADILGEAAKSMPDATKQQLAAFAREGSAGALPSTTLVALEHLTKSSGQENLQGA